MEAQEELKCVRNKRPQFDSAEEAQNAADIGAIVAAIPFQFTKPRFCEECNKWHMGLTAIPGLSIKTGKPTPQSRAEWADCPCQIHTRFKTEEKARNYVTVRFSDDREREFYQCQRCFGWHYRNKPVASKTKKSRVRTPKPKTLICDSLDCFETEGDVRMFLNDENMGNQEPYRCGGCGHWHYREIKPFVLQEAPTTDLPQESYGLYSCYTKKAYTNERTARSVAARVRDQRGTELRAYACTLCGQWHLTRRLEQGWKE